MLRMMPGIGRGTGCMLHNQLRLNVTPHYISVIRRGQKGNPPSSGGARGSRAPRKDGVLMRCTMSRSGSVLKCRVSGPLSKALARETHLGSLDQALPERLALSSILGGPEQGGL